MNWYKKFICDTFFGTIAEKTEASAKKLFVEKYMDFKNDDESTLGYKWTWKEVKK